jgi:hypothetical protein
MTDSPYAIPFTGGWNVATYTSEDMSVDWKTTSSPLTLFDVTGDVAVRVVGWSRAAITSTGGTGTIALGCTGSTGHLIAATTLNNTTHFPDTGYVWVDATPTTHIDDFPVTGNWHIIADGFDIIATIATNDVTAGKITLICQWYPMTPGSTVTVH